MRQIYYLRLLVKNFFNLRNFGYLNKSKHETINNSFRQLYSRLIGNKDFSG